MKHEPFSTNEKNLAQLSTRPKVEIVKREGLPEKNFSPIKYNDVTILTQVN